MKPSDDEGICKALGEYTQCYVDLTIEHGYDLKTTNAVICERFSALCDAIEAYASRETTTGLPLNAEAQT